jgi:hypothetical protein
MRTSWFLTGARCTFVAVCLTVNFLGVADAQVVGDPVSDADIVIDGPPQPWLEVSVSLAAANRAYQLGGMTLFGASSPGGTILARVAVSSPASPPTGGWPHFEFIGIPPGTYYVVLIYGIVGTPAVPTSAWRPLTFGTSCAGPPGMSILTPTVNGTSVTLALGAASGAPNSCPPDYQTVEVGSAPGLADILTFVSPSAVFNTQNAPPGDYYLRSYAVNRFGRGPTSLEMPICVPGGTCTPPPQPANGTAVVSGAVTVSWTLPPSSGPAVTFHEIQVYRDLGGGALSSFGPPIRLSAATSVTGSVGPGAYTVFVRSASPCGKSAYSGGVSFTVP